MLTGKYNSEKIKLSVTWQGLQVDGVDGVAINFIAICSHLH